MPTKLTAQKITTSVPVTLHIKQEAPSFLVIAPSDAQIYIKKIHAPGIPLSFLLQAFLKIKEGYTSPDGSIDLNVSRKFYIDELEAYNDFTPGMKKKTGTKKQPTVSLTNVLIQNNVPATGKHAREHSVLFSIGDKNFTHTIGVTKDYRAFPLPQLKETPKAAPSFPGEKRLSEDYTAIVEMLRKRLPPPS